MDRVFYHVPAASGHRVVTTAFDGKPFVLILLIATDAQGTGWGTTISASVPIPQHIK